jgi:CO/xanthine dehydrogenase FAD-binding subunit
MSGSLVVSTSLDDALAALAAGARPVAGGTDLVVGARQGKKPLPDSIVAIHRLTELRTLTSSATGVRLGALTTHGEIVAHQGIRERYTALADASSIVGSHATRATGTIGGNVMTSSPAMDTGGPLLCLKASLVLQSVSGTRTVPLEGFWTGPGRSTARPDELLVAIELPATEGTFGSCYVRLEYRRQMEIAVAGATAFVKLEGDKITEARIAITALAPTIHRVAAAEALLVGTTGTRTDADAAAKASATAATPISDVRASSAYRTAMTAVIVRRAIEGAIARARGTEIAIPATSALQGAR